MNKPTDPLEEVREKIAWEVLSKMVTIDHVRVDIADMIYEYADQILSITLKRGEQTFTIADAIRDKLKEE